MLKPEPIDISEHVRGICDALGVGYHDVAQICIEPSDVDVLVYLLNEHGKKYLDKPLGHAVMSKLTFKVLT